MVFAKETVAVPHPYTGDFAIDGLAVRFQFLGGTRFTSLGPDDESQAGLRIDQGRLLLSTVEAAGEEFASSIVRIHCGEDVWYVELSEANTLLGLEVKPRMAESPNENFGTDSYAGRLLVKSGAARVVRSGLDPATITANQQLLLRVPGMAGDAERISETALFPAWMKTGDGTSSALVRSQQRYANLFEKEFDRTETVDYSVSTLMDDARPKIAELAVQCLALTNNVSGLAQGLGSEHEEGRAAAMDGLRIWMSRTPNAAEKLQSALQLRFVKKDSDVITRLLWGYSDADLRKQATSTQLVDWLDSPETVIRELAFSHIKRLSGRDMGYRPLSPAIQRSPATGRFRDYIDENGALIPDDIPPREANVFQD